MSDTLSIDPGRLKRFIKHACVIAKKQSDREKARKELQLQMQKLRKFASRKGDIEAELVELNKKINILFEKEVQLLGIEQKESVLTRELVNGVNTNKDKIKEIYSIVDNLQTKLDGWVKVKTQRERKIEELEHKIRHSHKENKAVLAAKLNKLEQSYMELCRKGISSTQLEMRIGAIKARLS
ncbi:MAG TPA: hypothetical protein VFF28_00645 [Candidatus Nanoarchaeia archaeon]|nr:hypothetical protein [Candidatus Nanoarchaeia archaeon]